MCCSVGVFGRIMRNTIRGHFDRLPFLPEAKQGLREKS